MENQIRFFSLGGLGEDGKNLYCLDVNLNIFILDAGIKYPGSDLFGVDEIIAQYSSLKRVNNLVKGIFLSHPHEEHYGAVYYILQDMNVPIYATKFTLEILKQTFEARNFDYSNVSLNEIDENSEIVFDSIKFRFFNVGHTVPNSLGMCITTPVGNFIYTANFTFKQDRNQVYSTNISKLNEYAKEGVEVLLCESLGSLTYSNEMNEYLFENKISNIFTHQTGRLVFSVYLSNLKLIEYIIRMSLKFNKRVAIRGTKGRSILKLASANGFIDVKPNEITLLSDDKEENNDPNLVILVTGNRNEPFYILQSICEKKDRYIELNENDTIVVLSASGIGTEKIHAKTLDSLYKTEANIIPIDKNLLPLSHATKEDIKIMINITKPKYLIPVIGEYRHMYNVYSIAKELGYNSFNSYIMENGDILYLKDNYVYLSRGEIVTSEILIDGTPLNDQNDQIMKDRESLAESGILFLITHIDKQKKQYENNVEIITKGFVYIEESANILEEIKNKFISLVNYYYTKNLRYDESEFKKIVKEKLQSFIFDKIGRSPIIIPMVIEM